jgi:MFS family permease
VSQIVSQLVSAFAPQVGDAVSRGARSVLLMLVAGVLLFAAFVMGLAALTTWLATQIDLWAALAIVALGLTGIGGITLGFAAMRSLSAEDRRKSEQAALKRDALLGTLSALGTGGRGSTPRTLIVAALVGLLAGSLLLSDRKTDNPPEG